MNNTNFFIQNIHIKNVRNIIDFTIPLDNEKRQHLIITSKNGSGKTSILDEINIVLNKYIDGSLPSILKEYRRYEKKVVNEYNQNGTTDKYKELDVKFIEIEDKLCNLFFKNIDLHFNEELGVCKEILDGKFILAFFEAKRENKPNVPNAIQNVSINTKHSTDTKHIHKQFIAYMVRLRNRLLNEKFDGRQEEAIKIANWFNNFENTLKKLFQKNDLKLRYYDEELNFKIEYESSSFGLNELSDGYSSLLAILTELILRMEAHKVKVYDMQGVVLIDEIETHLHVDLQKKVLPFLVDFFPNIQFIVSTHSPFVISSLPNAIICDLEKRIVVEDLSGYSYDALVESYFDSDKYSQEVKDKIEVFEALSSKSALGDNEKEEYYRLKKYFDSLPTFMSDELAVKLNEIKLRDLFKAV